MRHEVIDIIEECVAKASQACEVRYTDYKGATGASITPDLGYVFGSAEYFKDWLDEKSKAGKAKFPLVVLFNPITENRNDAAYYSTCKVNLLIACMTQKEWSNEQRKEYSFENVLRPIYKALLGALKADKRLDFGYTTLVRHDYSENYSYGKYGAWVDRSGEMVSEPIDAIDIRNLELKIKQINCRYEN